MKRDANANGTNVAQALETQQETADKDRGLNPPRGIVGEHELRLVASATADSREGHKGALDSEVDESRNTSTTPRRYRSVQHALDGAPRTAFDRRRAQLFVDRKLVTSLGIPVRTGHRRRQPTLSRPPEAKQLARHLDTRLNGRNLSSRSTNTSTSSRSPVGCRRSWSAAPRHSPA